MIQLAPTFHLYEYNPRRRARGVEAARVLVTWKDGDQDLLWMSPKDIQRNLDRWGESVGLREALAAYAANRAPTGPNTTCSQPGKQATE